MYHDSATKRERSPTSKRATRKLKQASPCLHRKRPPTESAQSGCKLAEESPDARQRNHSFRTRQNSQPFTRRLRTSARPIPALREPDSDRAKVGCGSDRSAVQGLAAGHESGMVAGAAVSDLTQFNHSNRREESAAGGGAGFIAESAIFAKSFRSAQCGAWRGSGRRRLARDRFQRRAERLDFVAGGGTAVIAGATRNEARWRSLLWGDDG